MDKLSKEQKDEYATAFAILALYDGGVSACAVDWKMRCFCVVRWVAVSLCDGVVPLAHGRFARRLLLNV